MASLDLSAVFDVVNIGLLRKRLDIIGIPSHVVSLINTWLAGRLFYEWRQLILYGIGHWHHTGSISGPIFYAIYISPFFI